MNPRVVRRFILPLLVVLLFPDFARAERDSDFFADAIIAAFKKDKDVVPWTKTGDLRDLLAAGKIDDFNELRRSPDYARKYVELSTRRNPLILTEAKLARIDLSRTLLEHADFSGSDLTGASFKEAYLLSASFYRSPRTSDDTSQRAPRPTTLTKTDFTAAHVMIDGSEGPHVLAEFDFTDCSKAIGLPNAVEPRYQDLARAAAARDGKTGIGFFAGPADGRLDVADHGKPCPNPFKDLTAGAIEQWTKQGVDVKKLAAMKAIRIDGSFTGANGRHMINKDADCVLVIGSPFVTHDNVYSLGPVVALEEAHFMGDIYANAPIWFREESFPRGVTYGPVVFADKSVHLGQATPVFTSIQVGDFAPVTGKDDWLRRMLAGTTIDRVAEALTPHRLPDELKAADKWKKKVELKSILSEDQYAKLIKKHPAAAKMKAVMVAGEHFGAGSAPVVNTDADTILVLKEGFASHDGVFSAGPIITTGDAGGFGPVLSQKWIMPFGVLSGERVIGLENEPEPERKNEKDRDEPKSGLELEEQ